MTWASLRSKLARQGAGVARRVDSATDRQQRLRLQRMQRTALGLLLVMALIYIVALSQRHVHVAVAYLVAFAEAAVIGAIADWFAVVALFRHPLGIPVWHTAIIANSKDDIGRNLGAFIETHFMTEAAIARRLQAANPAGLLGQWLLAPDKAPELGHAAAGAFGKVLDALDDASIRQQLGAAAGRQLRLIDMPGMAGKVADLLVAENKHQVLLDGVLQGVADYLADERNQPQIAAFMINAVGAENILYKAAITKFTPGLVKALRQSSTEVRADAGHPLRISFGVWVNDFVLRLKADADWQNRIARYQQEALDSEPVNTLLNGIWDLIKARLQDDLKRDEPLLGAQLATLLQKIGESLTADAQWRAWLNQAIESGSAALIRQTRGEVGKFIEAQLAQWTKDEMSSRIELSIGRDLQFIRISGTLVGGLVGLLIHALTQLLAGHP